MSCSLGTGTCAPTSCRRRRSRAASRRRGSTSCTPRGRPARSACRGTAPCRRWTSGRGPSASGSTGRAGARWWSAAGWAPTRSTSPRSASPPPPSTSRRPRSSVAREPQPRDRASTTGSPTCSPARGVEPGASTWWSRSSRCRRCRTRRASRPPTRSPGWSPPAARCSPSRSGTPTPAAPRPARRSRWTGTSWRRSARGGLQPYPARGDRRPALAGDVPPLSRNERTGRRARTHAARAAP